MARQVHCPGCGAVGTIAPCDNKVFQRRGVFEGKSVAKCKKCGCGLFFGPFSGTYFGKPKLIPKELWLWLNNMVQYFIGYVKDHDTVGFLIYDEEEFNYAVAYDHLRLTCYYGKGQSEQFVYAAEAYTALGFEYYIRKQFDEQIEYFSKAIQLGPKYAEAYYYRGIAYKEKRQYDNVIDDISRVIQLKPDHVGAYSLRGFAYFEKKQYDMALEDFNRTIQLKPDHYSAHFGRGLVYDKKGQQDRAIQNFTRAIELEPDYADEAYYNRGFIYEIKGNIDKAISDFQKACDLGYDDGCKKLQSLLEKVHPEKNWKKQKDPSLI